MADDLVFRDPAGVETDLVDEAAGFNVLWGVIGRGMPSFDFIEDEVPGIDGARLREVLVRPKEVTIPIHLEDSTPDTLRALLRSFASKLNPLRGNGTLVSTAAGDERELVCRYAGGYELSETKQDGGVTWQRALLVFRASSEPFWQDADDTVVPIEATGSTGSFFPIPPVVLLSSSVYADVEIDNSGDVRAWPVWTMVGPIGVTSGITFENVTYGRELTLDYELTEDDYIVIDTRPGMKSVRNAAGDNLYRYLTAHDLWPLEPGVQTVRISGAGVDDATSVSLSYRRRHLIA